MPLSLPLEPRNLDLERGLIGAVLIENRCHDYVAHILKPEHFGHPQHALFWSLISGMIERNDVANPVTVGGALVTDSVPVMEAGKTVEIPVAKYLAQTVAGAVSTEARTVESYAEQIIDLYNRRQIIAVCEEQAQAAAMTGDNETKDVVEAIDLAISALAGLAGERGPVPLAVFNTEALERAQSAQQTTGVSGITWGLQALDGLLGGASGGDLVLIAGRPSMGKTELLNNVSFYQARAGSRVVQFQLEMTGWQTSQRLLSRATGVSTIAMRQGNLDNDQWARLVDARADLDALPIIIDDFSSATVARIRTHARRLRRSGLLDVIWIDYLQRIQWPSDRRNENDALSAITNTLKSLAKELDVPVIVLSQLSRGVESRDNKRPRLDDLRGSGAIEQDADIVLFLFRESYYLERAEPLDTRSPAHADWRAQVDEAYGKLEIICSKQRMGPTGAVRVFYDPARSLICDWDLRPGGEREGEQAQGEFV